MSSARSAASISVGQRSPDGDLDAFERVDDQQPQCPVEDVEAKDVKCRVLTETMVGLSLTEGDRAGREPGTFRFCAASGLAVYILVVTVIG